MVVMRASRGRAVPLCPTMVVIAVSVIVDMAMMAVPVVMVVGGRMVVFVPMMCMGKRRFRFLTDAELRRRDARSNDALGPHGVSINSQTAKRTPHRVKRHTDVE
jgi:hypothetical protein